MLENTDVKVADNSIKYGVKALIIFVIIFLGWAIFLPIQSASIADGTVVLDFNRKTIQHFEGGIIDNILVTEGQMVIKNEPLLYLHDIRTKTEQQILKERLWAMQIQKTRLEAEKENKDVLDLSEFFSQLEEMTVNDNIKLQEIAENQMRLFKSRQNKRIGEIDVLYKKIQSAKSRLKILYHELRIIKPLVAEGNLPILRELELRKSIIETKAQKEEAKQQIENYKNSNLSDDLREIKEGDMEIVALQNQLMASKDVLKRSAVTAPVSGKIMNIKYHTIGAVVPPGGDIMNIVPQNKNLIIEAKVKPQDIDNVAIGLLAKVSLTAYQGKEIPKVNGEVINVSPDILTNEQTGESYFLARIAISKEDIESLKHKVELYPGMPAQVFIITGARSLVSYLFSPISRSAYKAFRED